MALVPPGQAPQSFINTSDFFPTGTTRKIEKTGSQIDTITFYFPSGFAYRLTFTDYDGDGTPLTTTFEYVEETL